ncbi:MAG: acyl-CoA dehydrogenase [Syntrophaceae bacterium]|nr:acyl-CoA dehydrogenase [Syntrophaceae bacterium]
MTRQERERIQQEADRAARFAESVIDPRRIELSQTVLFPSDLWERMGREGFYRIGIPAEAGGSGGGAPAVQAVGEALAFHGGCLGVVLSWLIQVMVIRWVLLPDATEEQCRLWLPSVTSGRTIISLAASEPKVGAHPKHLKTSAVPKNGGWVLNGEKSMLSNGPMAGLFVVLAVTGSSDNRKSFGTFLVPADTPGLVRAEPTDLKALHPSPHGGILLADCFIPPEAALGETTDAYRRSAYPFREIEDTLLMGPVTGMLFRQARRLSALLRTGADPGEEIRADLGRLSAQLDMIRILAREAAVLLEYPDASRPLFSLLFTFREMADHCQFLLDDLASQAGFAGDSDLAGWALDTRFTLSVGRNVLKLRLQKAGLDFINKPK